MRRRQPPHNPRPIPREVVSVPEDQLLDHLVDPDEKVIDVHQDLDKESPWREGMPGRW